MNPSDGNLKILQIVLALKTGGAEMLVLNLARRLVDRGFGCEVCSLESGGNLEKEARESGLQVWSLGRKPSGLDWRLPGRLLGVLRRGSYDVIHTHNFAPNLYAAPLAKVARVRGTINTQHGVMVFPCSRKRLEALKLLSRFTDSWVTVANSVREEMARQTGLAESRFTTIINGIDTQRFEPAEQPALKEKLGLSRYDWVLGTVGRLSPEKDHAMLLDAFEKILRSGRRACLVIVGDGEERPNLEQAIRRNGREEDVFLLGNRADIAELLGTFDVFVNSSRSEGIPLTILEAMSSGLPVVATRVGGIPEIVVEDSTGTLVPSQDSDALAAAVIALLGDREKLARFGTAARERVEQNFSLDAMTNQYISEYRRITSRKFR